MSSFGGANDGGTVFVPSHFIAELATFAHDLVVVGAGTAGLVAAHAAAALGLALILCPLMVRLSGTAFSMLHLAFGQLVYVLALKLRGVTGGEDGVGGFPIPPFSIPGILSIEMKDPSKFYYFAVIVLGASMFVLWFVTKTPFGSVMVGVRDNPNRVAYLGYRVPQTKAVVYLLSGGFAEVTPLGPVPVKGLAGPIEVFELTGAGAARTRLEAAARRGLTRFVGRTVELTRGPVFKPTEEGRLLGHVHLGLRMIEEGRDCQDIVTQLAAASRAHI